MFFVNLEPCEPLLDHIPPIIIEFNKHRNHAPLEFSCIFVIHKYYDEENVENPTLLRETSRKLLRVSSTF